MCLRHKHFNWAGHSAIINPAKGGEGSSLTSIAATADNAATIARSVAAAEMTVADKNYTRDATANDKVTVSK